MSDWPSNGPAVPAFLSTASAESCGIQLLAMGVAIPPTEVLWPLADLAIFVPFRIDRPTAIGTVWQINGGTLSGFFDIGLYNSVGRRLWASGSQAQSGTSNRQGTLVASGDGVLLPGPGWFYLALAVDNALADFLAYAPTFPELMGAVYVTTAFPLPALATFAPGSTAFYLPVVGMTTGIPVL